MLRKQIAFSASSTAYASGQGMQTVLARCQGAFGALRGERLDFGGVAGGAVFD